MALRRISFISACRHCFRLDQPVYIQREKKAANRNLLLSIPDNQLNSLYEN